MTWIAILGRRKLCTVLVQKGWTSDAFGTHKDEKDSRRFVALVTPRMARTALYRHVPGEKLRGYSIVKLQMEFTLDEEAIVDGLRTVHPRIIDLKALR